MSVTANARPTYGKELCLLSLDGGGVRGLSSLQILKQLMESINPESPPKPCDYFDMIGGTSTGGLIALMLGRLRMSVDVCIAAYTDLSSKIFTQLHHRLNWKGQVQGRFDHKALEDGVKKLLVQQGLGEETLLRDPSPSACKTFVCATSKQTSSTVVLSSYFSKRRGLDMLHSAKIWEAARATSAASSFFDSIEIGDEEFVDGASRSNNPINSVWTEAFDTWRDGDDWKLEDNVKCLVSIGTGIPSLKPFGDDPINIGKILLAMATDTEALAEDFQRHHTNLFKEHRYFRFNVLRGLENIGLEEASKKKEIRAATRDYIQTETVFNQLEACAVNLNEREWLKKITEKAHSDAERRMATLGTSQAGYSDPNALAWFTNTSDYDWWLHSAGSLLWYPAPLSPSKVSHPIFSASLCKYLLEHAELAIGSELCVLSYGCPQDIEASFGANERAPEDGPDASVEATAVLWSLIGQALVAGYNSNEEIQASVYRLKKFDRELLRKRLEEKERVSLHVLMRLLQSVLSMRAFPETVVLIDNIENMARSQVSEFLIKIRQMLNEMALSSSIHALITGMPVEDVDKALNGVRVVAEDTECRECLRSLHFEGIFTRRDQVAHAVAGTNEWIWHHPEYSEWERKQSGILWIQGKPGSGKSVLAKSIQTQLSLPRGVSTGPRNVLFTRSGCNAIVGSWFYSGRGGRFGNSHGSMLRSILYQLLDQDQSLFQYYQDAYRTLRRPGTGHCRWSIVHFQEILSRMAAAGEDGPQILSVVDGLDESEDALSDNGSRRKILSLFSSLVYDSRIKVIVLSRPARAIEREFRHCHHIVLEAENENDIERVADAGLRSLLMSMRSFDSSDEETSPTIRRTNTKKIEVYSPRKPHRPRILNPFFNKVKNSEQAEVGFIRAYLLEHAQGVILWVTLLIGELKRRVENGMYTFKELEEQLLGLPLGLNNVYERIVEGLEQRHNDADRAKSKRILAWVIGASAKQPLRLKELLDALAIPSDLEASLKSDDDPIVANRPMIRSWNHFRRSLHELCGPLVEVIRPVSIVCDGDSEEAFDVGPSSVVQLLHQTVKDFLANRQTTRYLYIRPFEAETMVRRDGHQYLQLSLPLVPTPYAPKAVVEGDGWEGNTEEVVSYLEDRFLLRFVLCQPLPDPYHDIYHGKPSPDSTAATLSAFLKQSSYTTRNAVDTVKNVLVGRYIWFACGHGLVTAVENLLTVGPMVVGWWMHYADAVLHGAFLAAIDNELLPTVKELAVRYRSYPLVQTSFADVVPLIDRAARTGNEELTMYLFDATSDMLEYSESERAKWLATARKSSRSSPSPNPIVEEVKNAIWKVWMFFKMIKDRDMSVALGGVPV